MSARFLPLLVLGPLAACATAPVQQRAGVLDYLYPEGVQAAPPADVKLALPLRVGVAFAPTTSRGETSAAAPVVPVLRPMPRQIES